MFIFDAILLTITALGCAVVGAFERWRYSATPDFDAIALRRTQDRLRATLDQHQRYN